MVSISELVWSLAGAFCLIWLIVMILLFKSYRKMIRKYKDKIQEVEEERLSLQQQFGEDHTEECN